MAPKHGAKVLIYDIENAPNLGYVWEKWQTNVLEFKDQWFLLSFAWKWLGERETHVLGLDDMPGYEPGSMDDRELVTRLRDLFDEADITVTHNGISFDNKKAQTRMIVHGIDPPSSYKEVDTLRTARKQFAFTSNRLGDLCQALGLPSKASTGGMSTWFGCMNGDPKSWAKMKKYNKQDVIILEKLYKRFIPWLTNYPHMGAFEGRPDNCPKCGKGPLVARGWRYAQVSRRRQFHCKSCGGYSMSRKREDLQVPMGER